MSGLKLPERQRDVQTREEGDPNGSMSKQLWGLLHHHHHHPSLLHQACKSLLNFCQSPLSPHISACFFTRGHIVNLCTEALSEMHLHSLYSHHHAGMPIASDAVFCALEHCTNSKDLVVYKRIHALVISIGFSPRSPELHHALIHLFSQCSALLDANLAFSSIKEPNIFTWYAIISAHVILAESQSALVLYFQMLEEGLKPSKSLYLCALKACGNVGSLGHGRLIHCDILRNGMESGVVVGTNFVDFYAKCGCLEDAHVVFEKLSSKNVVSWGALMAGYAQHGHGLLALKLYEEMQNKGLIPDDSLHACALKACGSVRAMTLGQSIHDRVIRQGTEQNIVLGNTLIDMYAKCGTLGDARKVFDILPNRTAVTWSAMLAGYASDGNGFLALELYLKTQHEGMKLSKFMSSSILKACGKVGALKQGRFLHDRVIRSGHEGDIVVGNALIDMYARCGSIKEALTLFDISCSKDEVSWGSIISGCVQANASLVALQLFERMQREEKFGNIVIFSCALQACGGLGAFKEGKVIHNLIVVQGVESNNIIGSTLVDMYAKCGSLSEACRVFESLRHKTLASWGALIDGYASQETHGFLALDLFQRMQYECSKPNIVLYSSALKACSGKGSFWQGRVIHSQIICSGLEIDIVAGNVLVDMYIKSGSIDGAHKVFDELIDRDVVTWNSLIFGYTELCHYSRALELYDDMQKDGMKPDRVTYLCALKACGGIGSLGQGMLLHISVLKGEVEIDLSLGNALMDMYSRCGSMEDAERVFADMPTLDVISWGTVIAGYAQHGNCEATGRYLQNMRIQGLMADEGIFSSVLAACRQAGHVADARRFFLTMREDHGVAPCVEHFNIMADLIARTGRLHDAEKFLDSMPIQADATGWMSLLTSCNAYGNIELGRKCFEQAILVEPDCAAGYMLMWSIYADAQQWDEVDKICELRQLARVQQTEEACEVSELSVEYDLERPNMQTECIVHNSGAKMIASTYMVSVTD